MAKEQTDAVENQQDEQNTRTIFVTGADTGVGRVVTRALIKRGYKVTGTTTNGSQGAFEIRRDGALPVYPDLTRAGEIRSTLLMAKADVVVHLAAQAVNEIPQQKIDYARYVDILAGTQALAEAAQQTNVTRIIFPSFAFLYGDKHGEPTTETARLDTSNELFKAAAQAEQAILACGVPSYVLRAGFVYGGSSSGTQQLIDGLRRGQNVPSGTGMAGWLHEDDLANVILQLIEREAGDDEALATLLNIADDTPQSPNDFIYMVGNIIGVGKPSHGFAGGMLKNLFGSGNSLQDAVLRVNAAPDTSRIKSLMDWQPLYKSAQQGIEQMLLVWRAREGDPEEPAVAALPPIPDAAKMSREAVEAKYGDDAQAALETEAEEAPKEEKPKPAAKAASSDKPKPSAEGPTPWSESEAKREERRQAALARKAARAAKNAEQGG